MVVVNSLVESLLLVPQSRPEVEQAESQDLADRDLYQRTNPATPAEVTLDNAIEAEVDLDPPLTAEDAASRIAAGESLRNANLTGADFSMLAPGSLHGVDLSGAILTGACLAGLDLSNTNLSGAILDGADLTECILSQTINVPQSWAAAHPVVGYVEHARIEHIEEGDNDWSRCLVEYQPIHIGADGQYFDHEGKPIGFEPPDGLRPFDESTGRLNNGTFYFNQLSTGTVDGIRIYSLREEGETTYHAQDTNVRIGRDEDYPRYNIRFERRVSLGDAPILNNFDPTEDLDTQFPASARYIRQSANLQGASMVHCHTLGLELDGIDLDALGATIVDIPLQRLTVQDVATRLANGETDFSYVDLSGIDFRGTGVDFTGCTLTGSSLAGANLSKTNMDSCSCSYVDFSQATLSRLEHLPGADQPNDEARWRATHPVVGYVERTRTTQMGDNDPKTTVYRTPVRIDTDGYYHLSERGLGTSSRHPLSQTPPKGFMPLSPEDGLLDNGTFSFHPEQATLADLGTVFLRYECGDNEELRSYSTEDRLLRGIDDQHRIRFGTGPLAGRAFHRELVQEGGRDSDPVYNYIPLRYEVADGRVTFTHEAPPPLEKIGESPLVSNFDPTKPLEDQLPASCYAKSESVSLVGAELLGCDLRRVEAPGLVLENTLLEEVNASGANLSHASLESVVADRITLDNTNLEKASLRNVTLLGGSMTNARARGLRSESCIFYDVDLQRADLSNAQLTNGFFNGCNVAGANAHGLRAHGSNLYEGSNFESAHFSRKFACRHVPGCPAPDKSFLEKLMPGLIKAATTIAFGAVPGVGWLLGPMVSSVIQNNGIKDDFLKDWGTGILTNVALKGIPTGGGETLGGFRGVGNYASGIVGEYLGAGSVAEGIDYAALTAEATKVVTDTLVSNVIRGGDLSDVGLESVVSFAGGMAFSTTMSSMSDLPQAARFAVANSVRYTVEQSIRAFGGLESFSVDSLSSYIVETISGALGSLADQSMQKAQTEKRAAALLGFGSVEALLDFCAQQPGGEVLLLDAMRVADGEMTTDEWNDLHILQTTETWESLPEGMTTAEWESLQTRCSQEEVTWALNQGMSSAGVVAWVENGNTIQQLVVCERLMSSELSFTSWSVQGNELLLEGESFDAVISGDGSVRRIVDTETMAARMGTLQPSTLSEAELLASWGEERDLWSTLVGWITPASAEAASSPQQMKKQLVKLLNPKYAASHNTILNQLWSNHSWAEIERGLQLFPSLGRNRLVHILSQYGGARQSTGSSQVENISSSPSDLATLYLQADANPALRASFIATYSRANASQLPGVNSISMSDSKYGPMAQYSFGTNSITFFNKAFDVCENIHDLNAVLAHEYQHYRQDEQGFEVAGYRLSAGNYPGLDNMYVYPALQELQACALEFEMIAKNPRLYSDSMLKSLQSYYAKNFDGVLDSPRLWQPHLTATEKQVLSSVVRELGRYDAARQQKMLKLIADIPSRQ